MLNNPIAPFRDDQPSSIFASWRNKLILVGVFLLVFAVSLNRAFGPPAIVAKFHAENLHVLDAVQQNQNAEFHRIHNLSIVDSPSQCGVDDALRSSQQDYRDPSSMYSRLISWVHRIRTISVGSLSPLSVYMQLLDRFPLLTKSMTAGFIGGWGDSLAQVVEIACRRQKAQKFDLNRAISVAAEGIFISGPLMHFFYDMLDSVVTVRDGAVSELERWAVAATQVIIDCVLMDALFVASLMTTTAILEGKVYRLPQEFRYEFFATLKVSWLSSFCFAPIQCIMFRYVPVALRVLTMNIQDIIWNAAVSFMTHRTRIG